MTTTLNTVQLGTATVLDLDGKERKLGCVWAESTVVLAFVRHFG